MNIVVVTLSTQAGCCFATGTKCSRPSLFSMPLVCFLCHLHHKHIRRIAFNAVNYPAINQTERFPRSRWAHKLHSVEFSFRQTIHRLTDIGRQVSAPPRPGRLLVRKRLFRGGHTFRHSRLTTWRQCPQRIMPRYFLKSVHRTPGYRHLDQPSHRRAPDARARR